MDNEHLQSAILSNLHLADKPLYKESAMVIVRELLQDYPKQMQEFGYWFEKNAESVLERINAGGN